MKIWENKYLFKKSTKKMPLSQERIILPGAISISVFWLIQVDGLLPARSYGDSCNTVIQRFDIK
jgi:hypothetical protein